MKIMKRGIFITVEGVEGVGKTTAIRVITDYILHHSNHHVVATREPGGTLFCEKIRDLFTKDSEEPIHSDTEVLLLFASRNQHIQKLILPALENNQWVICDRYFDATHAYQVASGVSPERIKTIEDWMTDLPLPDLTFYLDAPISVCLERLNNRKSKDRIEARSMKYFSTVRQNYLNRAKENPDRFCIISADCDIKEVHANIQSKLADILNEYA